MALAGNAPKRGALSPATTRDLRNRLGSVAGARINVSAHELFGETVVKAVHTQEVPLGDLDKSLKGVFAIGHQPVLVGSSGGHAALMGVMPNPVDTESEVRSFVKTLLAHDCIDFGRIGRTATRSVVGAPQKKFGPPTHTVRTIGGKKMLKRIRFLCPGGGVA